jgi:hypothetical protein
MAGCASLVEHTDAFVLGRKAKFTGMVTYNPRNIYVRLPEHQSWVIRPAHCSLHADINRRAKHDAANGATTLSADINPMRSLLPRDVAPVNDNVEPVNERLANDTFARTPRLESVLVRHDPARCREQVCEGTFPTSRYTDADDEARWQPSSCNVCGTCGCRAPWV